MSTSETVRVRFAPSPTGYLHVGGARTALFNWLFARHHGGVFVLRIEDTDRERSSPAMTQAILDSMAWLGLAWDEGPLHQADGFVRHRTDALHLLETGAAYRCFCTPEELAERRAAHPEGPAAFRYERRCLNVPPEESAGRAHAGEPHTIRFRVPAGVTSWTDAVYGEISFENASIEDFIIMRTDGTPIYNMAVVSDDVAMRITHVIRGDDHVSNTPKQILLYHALGKPVPVFAHVPMILGPDGRRLSKRHGATAVGEYRTDGILPDALVNFLALLGWNPGTEEEIFTRAELIQRFTLENINKKSAIFDTQKLLWMNARYLAQRSDNELGALLRAELAPASDQPPAWWSHLASLLKVRARTLNEMIEQARPYLRDDIVYDRQAVSKHWKDAARLVERFERLTAAFAGLSPWEPATLEPLVRSFAEGEGLSAGKLIHPLRVALTGVAASPGIFDVMSLLGRERVLYRLRKAIEVLRSGAHPAPDGVA